MLFVFDFLCFCVSGVMCGLLLFVFCEFFVVNSVELLYYGGEFVFFFVLNDGVSLFERFSRLSFF